MGLTFILHLANLKRRVFTLELLKLNNDRRDKMETKLKKKIDDCYKFLDDVDRNMRKLIIGQTALDIYRAFMVGLLAPIPRSPSGKIEERTGCGHIWLEAVPGTGKTLAAKGLALMSQISNQLTYKRIQFTPDMKPTHIIGGRIFNPKTGEFRFEQGPIFSNIVLVDEKNRGTPEAKSGLLETAEEVQVTVEGTTYHLKQPFFIIATDNPKEDRGVFPDPAADRDRYTLKVRLFDLSKEEKKKIIFHDFTDIEMNKVVTAKKIMDARKIVREQISHSPQIKEYIANILQATLPRESNIESVQEKVQYGVDSNRAWQHFGAAAKAQAFLNGRLFISPDDVRQVAFPIIRHRIVLTDNVIGEIRAEKKFESDVADEVIKAILEEVPIP